MIGGLLGDRMRKKIPIILIFIALVGCIGQKPTPVQTETPTSSPIPTEPPKPNAIVGYAKDKLSQEIITMISPADKDGVLDEVEKSVVDYLKMLPEEKYRKVAAQEIMRDSALTKEDVTFLANYSNSISRSIKEMEDLKNDNVTLEDGVQTELEKKFMGNSKDQKLADELKNDYLEKIKVIYPELASELKKLPELAPLNVNEKSLEGLEDIYGLLLTAKPYTNYNDRFKSDIPKENETWEAFELMIAGGTPDPKDYTYPVPNYNTELQALLWIAEQNEFKKNDTLAQSIAMDNGLYITIGDEQVKRAVYKDMNDLIGFFRETNLWQLENGYYLLENYPLEAKIALAWTGNQTPVYAKTHSLSFFMDKPLDIKSYNWNTVSISTLRKMKDIAEQKKWLSKNVVETIGNIENYFYFNRGYSNSTHWNFTSPGSRRDKWIIVDGERVGNFFVGNMDYLFNYFSGHDQSFGGCNDEASWVNTWGIAIGIATYPLQLLRIDLLTSHNFLIYYSPQTSSWTSYNKQLDFWWAPMDDKMIFSIFRPPISLSGYPGYIRHWEDPLYDDSIYVDNKSYSLIERGIEIKSIKEMISLGILSTQIKQWLFYSNG
jgi:hypothetical protein